MTKEIKTGLTALQQTADRLHDLLKSLRTLIRPEQQTGPKWRWIKTPDGGAALIGEEGELLLRADRMPKPYIARMIAAAPDLRMEKFGILFDRRFLETNGPEQLARAEGKSHALLFLDLDGMKTINDSLGHDVGDEILQTYFATVAFVVDRIGEAYCWGGDEVVVLLPGYDQARAEALRDEIESMVVKKCRLHPQIAAAAIAVGISGGIHVFCDDEPLMQVVKRADAAMYAIKKARKVAAAIG
jgi:diguanylate cyclase (GGDEF)-like protein